MLQFAAALRDVRLRASPLRLYRFGGLVLMAAGGAAVASAVLTGTLFAQAAPPPAPPHPVVPPTPLKTVAVPRPDLSEYVVNNAELVVLGKALFWDMQAGGDGVQACASCHFHAGADNRATNTLNAGANGVFSVRQAGGTLQAADFPFHKLANPGDARSAVVRDSDDVVGSQGVFKTHFDALAPGAAADKCTQLADAAFGNNRQVTGRNAPTVINAVFNDRNFWDGRAQFLFNTRNPFGDRDPDAAAWVDDGTLHKQRVLIPFSSLASQAVGPANNSVEMSCDGRNFMQLGRKMLRGVSGAEPPTPLAYQAVPGTDSVLGAYAAPGGWGLKISYPRLIMDTFAPKWWRSAGTVPDPSGDYTLIEANFSLFWGLAIQAYEETLIADQTRFDKFLEGTGTLTAQEQQGFGVFMGQGNCIACHGGAELTNASVTNAINNGEFLERMIMGNNGTAVYDNGFYNIGVRPTANDVGLGGLDPFKKPLSLTRLCAPPNGKCQPEITNIAARPVEGIAAGPMLAECLGPNVVSSTSTCDRVAVDGSFKVPGLRNVELTAPYFHNGGQGTLEDVVEFYNRGGDFGLENQHDLDPLIMPLGLTVDDKAALVAFLKTLTDERVRTEQKPFDHPQLCLPNPSAGMPGPAACTRPVVPGTPTSVTATAGNGQATISWVAPASTGGSPLLNYVVTSTPAGLSASVPPTLTSFTVAGLTNGTAYTFSVTAVNVMGSSVASAPSSSVIPTAPIPTVVVTSTPIPTVVVTSTPSPAASSSPAGKTSSNAPSGSSSSRPSTSGNAISAPSGPAGGLVSSVVLPDSLVGALPPAAPAPPALPVVVAPAADAAVVVGPTVPVDPVTPPVPDPLLTSVAEVGDSASVGPITTSVVIDPSVGGALSTPDGALIITVPAGEYDWLTLSVTDVSSLAGAASNLQVGSRSYALDVQDSSGARVVAFSPPFDLTTVPDLSLLVDDQLEATIVLALNPDSGLFEPLSTVEVDRGLVTSLPSLGAIPTDANESGE